MNHQGLGWPRTYFIWGFTCGALLVEAVISGYWQDMSLGLFLGCCSLVSFLFAKYSARPLFGAEGRQSIPMNAAEIYGPGSLDYGFKEPVVFHHVADSGSTYRCTVTSPANILVEKIG